ncbi:magnesium-translocating P-type ATPase [Candidatus Gracilibacteria bacterium]|nr:magnesium-translocating P-type ATPase [Candidatus Gracilibacteria bacterium]
MHKKTKKIGGAAGLSIEEAFKRFETSDKGLHASDAKARLLKNGANDISAKSQRQGLSIFISQFKSPLIFLLLGAAAFSFFLGDTIDAYVIWAIVGLSAVLGFFQEYKAEQALRELKKLVTVRAKVIRDGSVIEIDAKELVPGDIVHMNIGDIVPADIRLFNIDDFSTDESPLTGESLPVAKKIEALDNHLSLPQDLVNMAFMGTSVASGLGEGVVVATGMQTFFGKTSAFLKEKTPETNFQKSIEKFGGMLLKVTFVMTLFILGTNAVLGKPFFDSLLFAIALAVGITPEMLPILMTITLSNGALKMAKLKVITKTLAAVEDFGNIDTLCCDKTGTLTEGTLTLSDYKNAEDKQDPQVLLYGVLCNSAQVGKGKKSYGNGIDMALLHSLAARHISAELKEYKTTDKNEFDFERRRMSVVVKKNSQHIFISKGAPEAVLEICKMTPHERHAAEKQVMQYEEEGYRVIAVAEKRFNVDSSTKIDETNLKLVGFLLFLDPPKSTVKDSLHLLQQLGIAIKIISGDSALITHKICKEVGFAVAHDRVITGDELQKMSLRTFEHTIQTYNVFARVTPEQKYKIVSRLNKEGHIVGFLGDGINDAPALKAADVGISVDSATGIAKEAADIILLQKSLHVLAEGIMEGRKIFSNIMKYILNTISANFGNMFTVAASSIFLNFIPLLPSQILLNNFISDVPLFTIATDTVDPELIKRPRRWDIKLITRFMIYFGFLSTIFDLLLIVPLIFVAKVSPEMFRTAWFIESSLSEMLITFSIRTQMAFYKSRPSTWLWVSSVAAALVTFAIPYFAFGQEWFGFVPLSMGIIGFIIAILIGYFIAAEVGKKYFFKKFQL